MADAAGSALAHLQYYDARMRSPEYQLTEEESRALDQFRCVRNPLMPRKPGQSCRHTSPALFGPPPGLGCHVSKRLRSCSITYPITSLHPRRARQLPPPRPSPKGVVCIHCLIRAGVWHGHVQAALGAFSRSHSAATFHWQLYPCLGAEAAVGAHKPCCMLIPTFTIVSNAFCFAKLGCVRPRLQWTIGCRYNFICFRVGFVQSLQFPHMQTLQSEARRLYELELRGEHDASLGPRPADGEAAAEWEQRKLLADHELERTLEQERLRQVGELCSVVADMLRSLHCASAPSIASGIVCSPNSYLWMLARCAVWSSDSTLLGTHQPSRPGA